MSIISKGKLTPLGRILVSALMVWALAMIVPDFSRAYYDLGTLGLEADNDGRITSADENPAQELGIRKGDMIDLSRTLPQDLAAVFAGSGGTQYVRPNHDVRLYIASGSSGLQKAQLYTLHPQIKKFGLVSKFVIVADQCFGVFFIVLATLLVWRRPSPVTFGFFLYGLWFNPGQVYVAYAFLQGNWKLLYAQEVLQSAMQSAGYAGFVMFALRFPADELKGWRITIERCLPTLAILLMVLQCLGFGTLLGWRTEKISELPYYIGYAIDLLVLIILRIRLREQSPIDRQRTRWVMWGCRIGLFAFIFADSNATTSLWTPLWDHFHWYPSEIVLDCFFMLNAPLAIAVFHAVRRHRVIDVRLAASRAAIRALAWVIIGSVLVAVSLQIEKWVEEMTAQRVIFVAVIIVISLQLEWLHERICEMMDHVLFKQLYHAEERLARVASALAEVSSLDAVDRLLIEEPVATLHLASAVVFRLHEDGNYRPGVEAIGWPGIKRSNLHLTDPLIPQLKQAHGAMRLSDVAISMHGLPEGTAKPVLAVPMVKHRTVAAIALYGLHTGGDDLNTQEVEMLRKLSVPASIAYSEIEMDLLRHDLDELRAKMPPRQGNTPRHGPDTKHK